MHFRQLCEALFRQADADGSGFIDVPEMLALCVVVCPVHCITAAASNGVHASRRVWPARTCSSCWRAPTRTTTVTAVCAVHAVMCAGKLSVEEFAAAMRKLGRRAVMGGPGRSDAPGTAAMLPRPSQATRTQSLGALPPLHPEPPGPGDAAHVR